ncbi:MAG: alpha-glucoside transport system permease protein [Pseudorhodobacter sp.]
MEQFVMAAVTILVGVFGCITYFFISNMALDWFCPASGSNAGANINRANQIRPWLFLFPALALLVTYLVYPVFMSIYLSFRDAEGKTFVGGANYIWLINDVKFRESMVNNLLWLVFVPAASTLFGLFAAAVTDRIRWGNFAKAMIFMPMAISFVGAAVIWKLVYEYRPDGQEQIGILNAIWTGMGGAAQTWLTSPGINSVLLMIVLVWIQTGFAMVILSAALRGIPEETIEASILDGASPLQIFMKIKVPQIWGTILVVWTTITITVLKVFDIVLTMTNGQWGTQVLANLMFDWMFRGNDTGRASTAAIIIMLMVTPIMIWNIRNAVRESR